MTTKYTYDCINEYQIQIVDGTKSETVCLLPSSVKSEKGKQLKMHIIESINAMRDTPNPAEFVRRAKENEEIILEIAKKHSLQFHELESVEKRIQKLEEALRLKDERIEKLEEMGRFYADEENWKWFTEDGVEFLDIEEDKGAKAREALK